MRIGILVTNTDQSPFTRNYPEDGLKFAALIRQARPEWETAIYQVKDGLFPETPTACDGYIITGSPASVNGSDQWINTLLGLIRHLHAEKTPMAGMCFGHQAIAKALGGAVEKNPGGWGWGVAETKLHDFPPWLTPELNHYNLHAAHSEQVTQLPAEAQVIGGSSFCPVGAFIIGNHVFTTQYHPEMTKDFFADVTDAFESYIGKDVADGARTQEALDVDNAAYMECVARFFEMAKPQK